MIAQDTGSAIVGPARADIYFGAGDDAARMAGRIKNTGQFMMLLPRALDPVEAGRNVPLPLERPSSFSFVGLDPVDDPTDEAVPLPEPKPVVEPAPEPAVPPAKPRKRRKR